jgi:hypothetical protein
MPKTTLQQRLVDAIIASGRGTPVQGGARRLALWFRMERIRSGRTLGDYPEVLAIAATLVIAGAMAAVKNGDGR